MLGTTKSEGCPDIGGTADVLGGKAVIDWLNGRARPTTRRAPGHGVLDHRQGRDDRQVLRRHAGQRRRRDRRAGAWRRSCRSRRSAPGTTTAAPTAWSTTTTTPPGWPDTSTPTADAKCAAVRASMDAEDGDDTGNYNAFWAERDYRHGPLADVSKVQRQRLRRAHGQRPERQARQLLHRGGRPWPTRNVPRKIWVGQYQHVDPSTSGRGTSGWTRCTAGSTTGC